jgi:hypothetical protein
LLELLSREVRKMSSTIEEYKDEYNQVTYEILDYIDNLRTKTKESMMVGESHILRGINIFEEAVKAINPVQLDDEAIYLIGRCINIALFKEQERTGRVNSNINYGINSCYMMLDFYNKSKKRTFIKQ